MSDEKHEQRTGSVSMVPSGPSVTEVAEFLKRTQLVNLDTQLGTILEHASLVDNGGEGEERVGIILGGPNWYFIVRT